MSRHLLAEMQKDTMDRAAAIAERHTHTHAHQHEDFYHSSHYMSIFLPHALGWTCSVIPSAPLKLIEPDIWLFPHSLPICFFFFFKKNKKK